jgi:hypothetical protein
VKLVEFEGMLWLFPLIISGVVYLVSLAGSQLSCAKGS